MSDPAFFLEIDGVDIEAEFGFVASSVDGLWNAPPVTLNEQAIYQREGTILLDDEPTTPPRDLVVPGVIVGVDQGDFETKWLALKRFLGPRGTVDHTLVFGNQNAQQITARYMGNAQGPLSPQMRQRKVVVELHFHANDPVLMDAADQTVSEAVAGTPAPIPLGTERSRGKTQSTLAGSAASLTFTYKHYDGTPLGSLTLTHAFVASDVVVVDHDEMTITLNGVAANDLLSNGDFFRFDPRNGDARLAHWPTVEVDHGELLVTYRRRW